MGDVRWKISTMVKKINDAFQLTRGGGGVH